MFDEFKPEEDKDYIPDEEKKELLEQEMTDLGLDEWEKEEVRQGNYKIDNVEENKEDD